jgi:acyl-CoA synthetase (AMP-forming)/AMP-acid ligase II
MNLAAVIARHALHQPRKAVAESDREAFSAAEFDMLVRRLAARLRARGVAPGDVVGVRMRDTAAHLAGLVAVARVGGIILPLDWRAAAPEFVRLVERFLPKAVLTDEPKPLPEPALAVPVADIGATEPDLLPPADLVDAPLVFGLTSGTTGAPKGIVVSHEQMFGRFVVFSLERMMVAEDRFLAPLPLAYAAGREIFLSLACLGATLIIYPTLFDPADLARDAGARRASVVMVSPNMSRALLGLDTPAGARLMPDLRLYISSTGKLQPEERTAIRARIAPRLVDYYGSTGAGPVALIDDEAIGASPTAAGRLGVGVEVQIVDEEHRPLAPGEPGRIRIRGPGVTTGFTADSGPSGDEGIRDGWYYPGDLGLVDAAGILHLQGRAADLIKRGGLMVHAQEVEQALRLHEAIVDAAVVGLPSPSLGEEVAAFIVVRAPVTAQAVIAHCRRELAAYKVPQRVEVIDALPRNASGKVVKAELKKRG